ncbi:MAG: decaprenyl-phosphate phosphoribosyltransferase [Planctomycetota bacterium]|nr:decaprenyl-phosphate phosphoribosyltransferase [Planctomycetota bacterium]
MSRLRAVILTLRPSHWMKNLFVCAALVFSKRLFELPALAGALAGFVLFSMASGAVYIFNDICDIESDRRNPRTRLRPIASGTLDLNSAVRLFAALIVVALAGSFLIRPAFAFYVLVYIALNAIYSTALKQVVVIDAVSVAAGFVIRVVAGAELISVPPSRWLILCTFLLSLLLALGKRRHELALPDADPSTRREGAGYSLRLLDQLMVIVTAATVIAYLLYTTSAETVAFFGTKQLIWTTPFVFLGIFRYIYLVRRNDREAGPAELVIGDLPLVVGTLLWVACCVLIIYSV